MILAMLFGPKHFEIAKTATINRLIKHVPLSNLRSKRKASLL